ncbi:MAG: DegT/DnrJ/EryC1/StrS family aminotransferase, partial [Oscillospiraceae bacterium]|nr:DegT/DnrJ/EryC1/StrS family aminotransferase [Oscillospiraceae bacterium]
MAALQQDDMTALESELCRKTGASHCILTSGGIQGIILALRSAGVQSGDTVICPALGDPSLVHAVRYTGAQPVFADINPDTWLMDSFCLEYILNKRVRTNQKPPPAVIAANLFGLP